MGGQRVTGPDAGDAGGNRNRRGGAEKQGRVGEGLPAEPFGDPQAAQSGFLDSPGQDGRVGGTALAGGMRPQADGAEVGECGDGH